MNIIERPEAKKLGLIRYFTGRPCKRGHISERQVSNSNCCECDLHNERSANMTIDKIERRRFLQSKEGRSSEARARNNQAMRISVAYRKARKLQATPAWANEAEIESIYNEARRLTEETGVRYEVDHIVPLISPIVSGLHVPANLRPLPATFNRSKGNRHWPGHPNEG